MLDNHGNEMEGNIYNLYPQYAKKDRRQHNRPVLVERRSGTDRRATQRASIDSRLQVDLITIQKTYRAFSPNVKALTNNINKYDSFIKTKDRQSDNKKDIALGAVSTVPFLRRLTGSLASFENHDTIKGIGQLAIQAANAKPDLNDMEKAVKQIHSHVFKEEPFHLHREQAAFGFIRTTPLEDKPVFSKIAEQDKTLYDLNCCRKILDKLGAKAPEFGEKGLILKGSLTSKIIGRSMLRVPIMTLGFAALLEIPGIIKAKNHKKQTVKSTINIISTIGNAAILGAIGAYLGPAGSLMGIGLGTFFGGKLANKINYSLFDN